LKECFDHCSNYHKICMETATSILPSRVIDVGLDGQEPFLFETNRANGSYFTLSYCWGGMIPQRTTSLNVDQYKKIIPLDILPSTFRDAIVLTRRFGVRYLWIDALCIIQDSINDWEVESAQMATIYGQCRAMIAASRSTSSTSGIFHRRPKKHGFPLPSQVFKYFKPPELSVHAVFADLDLAEEQEASPLAKRAWTLQEAILPRAVMHFLDGSTVWKCLKMRVSESGQYETLALKLTNGVPALCQNGAGSYILDADPGYGWLALVQEYTRRTLTFESDKLKAISGIANAYGRHGSNLYINGIWLDDLSRGIMWQAQSKSPR
ncbi:HET-domain-containing protein, partial [Stipitochalara longipes BDJ]